MSQRLGPYRNEDTLQAVVKSSACLSENVQIEEFWVPYERKDRRYEGYVIRGAST